MAISHSPQDRSTDDVLSAGDVKFAIEMPSPMKNRYHPFEPELREKTSYSNLLSIFIYLSISKHTFPLLLTDIPPWEMPLQVKNSRDLISIADSIVGRFVLIWLGPIQLT